MYNHNYIIEQIRVEKIKNNTLTREEKNDKEVQRSFFRYILSENPLYSFNYAIKQFNLKFNVNCKINGKDYTSLKQNVRRNLSIEGRIEATLKSHTINEENVLQVYHTYKTSDNKYNTIIILGTDRMISFLINKNISTYFIDSNYKLTLNALGSKCTSIIVGYD